MGLGRIKNIEKLMKEDLALTLLKSESSDAERNYMKLIILMMKILMMIRLMVK